jgi:hypothetical protein
MEPDPSAPDSPLFELSRRYAAAADGRDVEGFLSVFVPDARLSICSGPVPGQVVRVVSGHEELAAIPTSLARYHRTFHFLGQSGYQREGDRASGEIYCVAHHLTVGPSGAQDKVMYIRYADEYHADAVNAWRIAHRLVRIDWTEIRPVDAPGVAS